MNYIKIRKLKDKLYFKVEDVASLLNIQQDSARVICSRYVRNGFFISIKRNFYVLAEQWEKYSREDFSRIANFLQVPSYISFASALSFYGVSTQIQRGIVESACSRRSAEYQIGETIFNFYKIKNELYSGFRNVNGLFIALKEKAFLDCVYLEAYGKYKLDLSAVDFSKLDKKTLFSLLKIYPKKIKERTKTYAGFI